jgi:hypothetical protein
VERIAASGPDLLEVVGRWFGVRGRRFVRPTLIVRRAGTDGEVRALAELEHKPWAAEDGEPWIAAFALAVDLQDTGAEIELSVAPDIAVALSAAGKKAAKAGDQITAGKSARTPVAKADPQPRPRRARGAPPEVEHLTARLANATQALEAERERRAAADQALDEERSTSRRLRTELGQARAELDLASAAQAEAAAAAQELETARRQLREAQQRHEQLNEERRREVDEAEHRHGERDHERERELDAAQRRHDDLTDERDQTSQAHAAARTALHERTGALESTREALAQERAESGRLRKRLARAEKSAGAGSGSASGGDTAAGRRGDRPRGGSADDAHDPPRGAPRRSNPHPVPDGGPRPAPAARVRPLNPSLRHRTYWLGRLLALLVLLIVLAAIWIVLHSTILNH